MQSAKMYSQKNRAMRSVYILLFIIGTLALPVTGRGQLQNNGTVLVESGATIIIDTNATLVNNGSVKIAASLINSGAISGAGRVVLNGTAAQTLKGKGTMTNLEVNTAGATILGGSALTVLDTLFLTAGTLASDGGLILGSTASNTARVARATGGTVTGDVIVNRYIPNDNHGAWRLLSVPVTGNHTIFDTWQAGGASTPDTGTLITSPLYTGSNGFDMNTSNASILVHDQGGLSGPSWTTTPITNTNATPLAARPGYLLYVNGDRNTTPGSGNYRATTLYSRGPLLQGTLPAITIPATGPGYTLVGNPYAATLDFETIEGTANLAPYYYIWDANLTGTYTGGGFKLIERIAYNRYQQTPQRIASGTSISQSRYIASGQAFFLKAHTAPASVVFSEASKAVPPFQVVNGTNSGQQIAINLLVTNPLGTILLADGFRMKFDNSFAASVDEQDILKMDNFSENLAVRREGKSIIMEKRPVVTANDTIFLHLTNTGIKDYYFEIGGVNMPGSLPGYLVDRFMGTQVAINFNMLTTISFSVTANAASAEPDRFIIVFKPATTLPVSFTTIKATKVNRQVKVDWNVENEHAVNRYEIERSADGLLFNRVGTQVATGNNMSTVAYAFLDINPLTGANYYRIKSIDIDGTVKYSTVVKVSMDAIVSFQVFPNPVAGNTINILFADAQAGIYTVTLLNAAGQKVFTKQVSDITGTRRVSLSLPESLPKGSYIVQITAPDKTNYVEKVFK